MDSGSIVEVKIEKERERKRERERERGGERGREKVRERGGKREREREIRFFFWGGEGGVKVRDIEREQLRIKGIFLR